MPPLSQDWWEKFKPFVLFSTSIATVATTALLIYGGLVELERSVVSTDRCCSSNAESVENLYDSLRLLTADCRASAVEIAALRASIREKSNHCARLEREIDILRDRLNKLVDKS